MGAQTTEQHATAVLAVCNFTRQQYTSASDTMQGRQKVADLDYESSGICWGDGARVQQHVAASQVPMHHIHTVQVGQGICQL